MSETRNYAKDLEAFLRDLSFEPYHDYWHKLGKFVHTFAQAEGRLLHLVRQLTQMQDPISNIVHSGLRMDAAKDLVNKIFDATNQNQRKLALQGALDQFTTINTVRNNILHWGATYDQNTEKFLVSNKSQNPPPSKLKEYYINPPDLDDMIADLEKIIVSILIESVSPFPTKGVWGEYLNAPWRYKPPQPSPPKSRSPQAAQSPKRQRRASRGSQQTPETTGE